MTGVPTDPALASAYRERAVTVTGGASFIGSHLVELLVEHGARVRVVDDLSTGKRAHLAAVADTVELVVGDVRDPSVGAAALDGADTVFHLAARHGGRGFIDSHPVACVGNAAIDNAVFSAAAEAGTETVVFTSSACAYPVQPVDEPAWHPLQEDEAGFDHPGAAFADGEYGWAKLYGELQLAAFAKEGRFTGVACRLFNAYGPRENETHAVVALIDRALRREDPFLVWGDGTQQRAFTYVGDTVRGLALAGSSPTSATFNVGTSTATTIDQLCDEIFDAVGWHPDTVFHDTSLPVGSHTRVADHRRLTHATGWEPRTTLPEGIARTVGDRASGIQDR